MTRRPSRPRDRVFLDANVLFSAAYREDAGLRRLWSLPGVDLMTSIYALEEARRNLAEARQLAALRSLAARIEVAPQPPADAPEARFANLPADDRPILAAAAAAGCSHLLTGDRRAFGPWFGRRLAGVLILRPAEYLAGRSVAE